MPLFAVFVALGAASINLLLAQQPPQLTAPATTAGAWQPPEWDGRRIVHNLRLKADDDTAPIVPHLNITFSCNASVARSAAPSYCVESQMARYLPLPGKYFGFDVQWDAYPEATLWQLGDGLTFTDDIPICYHRPSVGAEKVNITSFVASIRHYKLATTYCNWGNLGNDLSTAPVAGN
eukprot:SAG31_NODE_12325_length_949_cov_1.774118_1_plen_178_part_00